MVFLGDSITHNWGSPKYTDYFQRDHKTFIPVNRGIGGQNVAQMLLRMRPDVIDLQPKAVVLFAGTNDLPTFKVPDLMKFIEDNFSSIFDLAEVHHIPVVICSVLPVNDAFTVRTETRPPARIKQLNEWLRQTAQRRGMIYVDFYSALTDGNDRLRKDLTLDGLHPTSAGYSIMEPLIESAILKSLEKKEK
ncbi:MAG: lipolytic protein family [Acidobacteriaceae bacterium]|nr:lipolytic protein family [Acidobacteriaceae bacterium]